MQSWIDASFSPFFQKFFDFANIFFSSLDTEYSLASNNRPNLSYLDPWIVTLLLEYKESVIKTDGQLGHVLKVDFQTYLFMLSFLPLIQL